ncbi:hypothetical protein HK096_010542, partial [Nowakowskiella sp. JEL0078]
GATDNLDWSQPLNTNNPTYEYFPSKNGATWPKKLTILDVSYPYNLYPASYLLPNGLVFIFCGRLTSLVNPITDTVDDTSIPPLDLISLGVYPRIYPNTPSTILMPLTIKNNWTAEIQSCGGTTRASNVSSTLCMQIKFTEGKKWEWVVTEPLPTGKVMADGVLLPDGTIFYTNGGTWGEAGGSAGEAWSSPNPSFESFIYDPVANGTKFRTVASAKVGRLYHSGALLTPEGSVVTTGSEMANFPDLQQNRTDCYPFNRTGACSNPFETRMELFSPPYMRKSRPSIYSISYTDTPNNTPMTDSSPRFTYGSSFYIYMSTDATNIKRVTITRYSSTTHSTNLDQRLIELTILSASSTTKRLVVEAPKSGFIAPPGLYMVWCLDGSNVPSVSVTVLIGQGDVRRVLVSSDDLKDANAGISGQDANRNGLSGTVIAIIIVLVIAGVVAALIAGWLLWRRKKKSSEKTSLL